MCRFALIQLEGLRYDEDSSYIYKLEINGKCQFDDFWAEMKKAGNHKKDLDKTQTFLSFIENRTPVPDEVFKILKEKPKNDVFDDFELKVGRLRFYLFQDKETGLIIVLGEMKQNKKDQQACIAKMREIKMEYFKNKDSVGESDKIEIDIV